MKIRTLIIYFWTICFCLSAKEDPDQIIVHLSSEPPLLPIYLTSLCGSEFSFKQDYLNSLEQILSFDFDHNGMTYVVKKSTSKEALAKSTQNDLTNWIDHDVYFVIQLQANQKQLNVRLLLINSNEIKTISGLNLTGNLNQDRRSMHQLADQIYKALFNEEGIATSHILYTLKWQDSPSKKWFSEVYESDYDGGNPRQVTRTKSFNVTPTYIPARFQQKSGSFLFVSYQIGQPKIYLGNLVNGETQRFSFLKGNQLMPAISRQRDQIAFICDVTGNPDLFLQKFDPEKGPIGKPRQIYTTHKATQGTPTFSPDGKKIAFVSNKDGHPRIYIIDIPAEGVPLKQIKAQLITKHSRENSAPAWSPDGKKIAYCSMTKGIRQIWIYDLETHSERQITQGPGNKENPTWAANSHHIMFNTSDPQSSEIYLTHILHPKPQLISINLTGEKHFPAWEIKQ